MMRLFVAIALDEAVKRRLVRLQRSLERFDEVRWTPVSRMHLTVKFFGDVADERVADLCRTTAETVARLEPFTMELAGCGCFPARGSVRVVWAGVRWPNEALLACAEALFAAYETLGFDREARAFAPHITIGRLRTDDKAGKLRRAIDGATMEALGQCVGRVAVIQSVLSAGGATYSTVADCAMRRAE